MIEIATHKNSLIRLILVVRASFIVTNFLKHGMLHINKANFNSAILDKYYYLMWLLSNW